MFLELAYDFTEGLWVSAICITIVYAILYLITLSITPLKYIKDRIVQPSNEEQVDAPKPFGIEDVTDEDMMVAALVASIDYQEQTKKDVQVKSIREIK